MERTQIGHRSAEEAARGSIVPWRGFEHAVYLFRGIRQRLSEKVFFGVKMSVEPAVGKTGAAHYVGYADVGDTMLSEFCRGSLDDTGAGVAFMFFRPWHEKGYSEKGLV